MAANIHVMHNDDMTLRILDTLLKKIKDGTIGDRTPIAFNENKLFELITTPPVFTTHKII